MAVGQHFSVYLNQDFSYYTFVHDPNFYLYSKNPGLPLNYKKLNTKNKNKIRFTTVQHENLDIPTKRCQTEAFYSFSQCIKETFSRKVGCRLHWDSQTDANISVCGNTTDYR